jgi:hypothetical protein
MTPARGRRRPCSAADARSRRDQAKAYLDTAKLVRSESGKPDDVNFDRVAAGNAVLAAIAAADAITCRLLGERSRGQDHRQAIDLLAQVRFGGRHRNRSSEACSGPRQRARCRAGPEGRLALRTLMVSGNQLQRLIRAAEKLVAAADTVV